MTLPTDKLNELNHLNNLKDELSRNITHLTLLNAKEIGIALWPSIVERMDDDVKAIFETFKDDGYIQGFYIQNEVVSGFINRNIILFSEDIEYKILWEHCEDETYDFSWRDQTFFPEIIDDFELEGNECDNYSLSEFLKPDMKTFLDFCEGNLPLIDEELWLNAKFN